MKVLKYLLLVCFPLLSFAQNKADVYKISYDQYMNDKKVNTTRTIFYQDQIVYFSKPEDKNQQFIDLKNNKSISTILFENQIFKKETPIDSLPRPSIEDDTQFILGYPCKHASFSYFSNKIDVWYTEKSLAKGTPHSSYLPNSNALVLKMTFNDNQTLIATSIEKVKNYKPTHNFSQNTQLVNSAEFEDIIIKSRYNRLTIFDDEILNFDPNRMLPKESELVTDKAYHFSKGSVVMKKIKVTPEMKGSGSIFAKLTCKSNGDAYDRTGSVFVFPAKKDMSKTLLEAYLYGLDKLPVFIDNNGNQYQGIKKEKDYAPPIEILRFYTSFGVNYFNDKRKINN